MSYMKTGCANRWATREFEQEVKTGHLRFIDWLDFEEEFRKDFMPLDSESTAINVLETTAYFQGKRTVDDYLNQFRDLIYDSGYTNLKTVVVKFRRGLDRRLYGPRRDDIRKTFGYGPRSLVPSRSPDGSKPRGRRGIPRLSPTTLCPDSCGEPPFGDVPTRPNYARRMLHPLQPVPGQPRPDGHRRGTEDQGHSRHLPALRKDQTLGKGL